MSFPRVGGFAGALVFMLCIMAGLAGGFLVLIMIRLAASAD